MRLTWTTSLQTVACLATLYRSYDNGTPRFVDICPCLGLSPNIPVPTRVSPVSSIGQIAPNVAGLPYVRVYVDVTTVLSFSVVASGSTVTFTNSIITTRTVTLPAGAASLGDQSLGTASNKAPYATTNGTISAIQGSTTTQSPVSATIVQGQVTSPSSIDSTSLRTQTLTARSLNAPSSRRRKRASCNAFTLSLRITYDLEKRCADGLTGYTVVQASGQLEQDSTVTNIELLLGESDNCFYPALPSTYFDSSGISFEDAEGVKYRQYTRASTQPVLEISRQATVECSIDDTFDGLAMQPTSVMTVSEISTTDTLSRIESDISSATPMNSVTTTSSESISDVPTTSPTTSVAATILTSSNPFDQVSAYPGYAAFCSSLLDYQTQTLYETTTDTTVNTITSLTTQTIIDIASSTIPVTVVETDTRSFTDTVTGTSTLLATAVSTVLVLATTVEAQTGTTTETTTFTTRYRRQLSPSVPSVFSNVDPSVLSSVCYRLVTSPAQVSTTSTFRSTSLVTATATSTEIELVTTNVLKLETTTSTQSIRTTDSTFTSTSTTTSTTTTSTSSLTTVSSTTSTIGTLITTTAPLTTTETLQIPACRTSRTLSIYTSLTSFVDAITTIVEPIIVLTTLSSFVCSTTPRTVTTTVTSVRTTSIVTVLITSCFTGQVPTTSIVTRSSTNVGPGILITLTSYSSYLTQGTSCTSYVTTSVMTLPSATPT